MDPSTVRDLYHLDNPNLLLHADIKRKKEDQQSFIGTASPGGRCGTIVEHPICESFGFRRKTGGR